MYVRGNGFNIGVIVTDPLDFIWFMYVYAASVCTVITDVGDFVFIIDVNGILFIPLTTLAA